MTKREEELLKKIAELEARIKVLEMQPPVRYEYHYHNAPQPQYWPALPICPQPWPIPMTPWVTCGGIGMNSHPAIQA